MAGMLPGVEAARRRRTHMSSADGGATTSTTSRRPSFCLYATKNQEFNFNSRTSVERSTVSCDEEMLDEAARESKRRLDLRFQSVGKSKGGERSVNSKTNLYRFLWKSSC